jgi:hypothetical protein
MIPEHLKHLADMFPEEFFDVLLVFEEGLKHGKDTWLEKDNVSLQHEANYASINRHCSSACCKIYIDELDGVDNRLKAATRLLMDYTKDKRKSIKANTDPKEGIVYDSGL